MKPAKNKSKTHAAIGYVQAIQAKKIGHVQAMPHLPMNGGLNCQALSDKKRCNASRAKKMNYLLAC